LMSLLAFFLINLQKFVSEWNLKDTHPLCRSYMSLVSISIIT
jgi:hypothetical protein